MYLNRIRPNSSHFPLILDLPTLSPPTFVCGHHGNHEHPPPAASCAPLPPEFNRRFLHAYGFGALQQSRDSLPAATTLENNDPRPSPAAIHCQ